MTNRITSLSFIFSLILILPACKKTVDSETNRWQRNQAKIELLAAEYPNFSSVLRSQLEEAKPIFENALQTADEEQKIALMDQANDLAMPRYVSQLNDLDKKIEALRESSVKLFEYAENNKSIMIAGIKSINVENTIEEARDYLKTVQVVNKGQAQLAVEKGIGKIDRLQKSITDSIKKYEQELKKEESANQ